MNTQTLTSVGELSAFAHNLHDTLCSRSDDRSGATVLALSGELGAGKTAFVQTLAEAFGVRESVTSPTFVIMHLFELDSDDAKRGGFTRFVHIDAYRIENVDEMRVLGFAELLKQPNTIICIEWAENIASLLPNDVIHLSFTITENDTRQVEVSGIELPTLSS